MDLINFIMTIRSKMEEIVLDMPQHNGVGKCMNWIYVVSTKKVWSLRS